MPKYSLGMCFFSGILASCFSLLYDLDFLRPFSSTSSAKMYGLLVISLYNCYNLLSSFYFYNFSSCVIIGFKIGANLGGLGKNCPFGMLNSTFLMCSFISSIVFGLFEFFFRLVGNAVFSFKFDGTCI